MRKRKLWIWLAIVVIAMPIVICVVLGLLPVSSDPILLEAEVIVGAREREADALTVDVFPAAVSQPHNPSTPEKEQLGYTLFFDPLLSASGDMACATCHHPDLGLSDGRILALGADGAALNRNTPSLYEVAYAPHLFRDGRAPDLETQAQTPLTHPNEMAADPDKMVARLKAIPDYEAMFRAAFPDQNDPITFENTTYALAVFERTLLAHNTPFDQYLAGDLTALTALTPSQRRGFALFRSGATGCYKCHAAPTFTNNEFEVTGVPGANDSLTDLGRGAISGQEAENHAFRTPSLRNVALTGPYMHNGVFESLREVVQFYAAGGGKGRGLDVPFQTRFVSPIDLSPPEIDDLVNFLYALTDEGAAPTIPDRVPSGLAVVAAINNPARQTVAQINAGSNIAATDRPAGPTTLTVTPDMTIQAVVDLARPGDTVEIEYGVYYESVIVDQHDLTIRGLPNAQGDWPVLDGRMDFSDGISASGDNFTVEQLAVKNYRGNGIIVDGATGVVMRDLYIENTSLYGAYPIHSTDVLIERVEATAIRDAGIYAGQSRNVVIRNNVVHGNVIGIEVENSIGAEVRDNHAFNNATGIFVDLLPQLDSKVSLDTRVFDNLVEDNNLENFALAGEIGALVPEGGGIVILGGDDVAVYNNVVRNNRTAGVAIFSTAAAFPPQEIDMGPNPERIHIHDNQYLNNGYDPDTILTDLGLDGADIIWDVSNWDIRVDEAGASSFPPLIPSSRWPDFFPQSVLANAQFCCSKIAVTIQSACDSPLRKFDF